MVSISIPDEMLKEALQQSADRALAAWVAALPKPEPVKFYSVPELVEITGHCRNTVVSWIEKGKKNPKGKVVKLKAHQFAPNHYRVELSDLRDFGSVHQLEMNFSKSMKIAS
jgi:hypothetical protein